MRCVPLLFLICTGANSAQQSDPRNTSSGYKSDGVSFYCVGNCDTPRTVISKGGNVLMGGHMYPGVTKATDLKAYQWFLGRSGGGDVLVLTADEAPCDIYNPLLYNLTDSVRPNSVTTACFTSRVGSSSKKLKTLLTGASGLFITGGDQAKYYTFWRNTPVAVALSSGVVVGGSSAGLAVQGQFVFDALHGGVSSQDALKYPTDSEVSLARHFLEINSPWMRGIITDTHFKQRDRMGRLVAFVARVVMAGWTKQDNQTTDQLGVLGIGISEHTAVLVDGHTGTATFVGDGPAYFLKSDGRLPTTCTDGKPLAWRAPGVAVWRWNTTDPGTTTFYFSNWTATPGSGTKYSLTVDDGHLTSTQPGGEIY